MVNIFLLTLILTAVFARLSVLIIPCPFTLTGFIRQKTKWYVHHIYIGLFIVFIITPLILVNGFNTANLILFTIGLSLSMDEIVAWITKSEYPKKKEFIVTVFLYLAFSLYVFLLSKY